MYNVKSKIYLNLDKTQKSGLCNYLKSLVRLNINLGEEDIIKKFLDDERYYIELGVSRFPFLCEMIEDADFLADTLAYVRECIKYYEYKEKQRPIIEAQKDFNKKKRKFLQEVKMSKEAPTKKQLYYYDRLCKRYSIDKKDVENLSRLDLRNEIERILDEHSGNYKITD